MFTSKEGDKVISREYSFVLSLERNFNDWKRIERNSI